jgi:hypothetical protein
MITDDEVWSYYQAGIQHIEHTQQDESRSLLVGRSVVAIAAETLTLDDGTEMRIVANEGCGGCDNGYYELRELLDNPVNGITAVEFDHETHDDDRWEPDQTYRIFVLTQDTRIKLAEVHGNDGNGYYGTGYWIAVRRTAEKENH